MSIDSKTSYYESSITSKSRANGLDALVPVVKHFALRFIRHQWKAILLGILGVLALATLAAVLFATKYWNASAMLLYTPLQVPQEFVDIYQPPNISSIKSMAFSDAVMEELKKEYGLPMPVKSLHKLVQVEVLPGTQNILEISLEWGNAQDAIGMVKLLTSSFPEEVARIRKRALGGYYENLEKHLNDCDERLASARKRLADYSRSQNIVDVDTDTKSLKTDISNLEDAMAKTQRRDVELSAQAKELATHIEGLKSQEAQMAREEEKYQAAQESVADARRRQDRLRELISEERRIMEVKAKLEAKRHDYDRASVLYDKRMMSKAQFEEIQAEMESLAAQVRETSQIKKWKEELQRIDETVVPKENVKQTGSPIIAQVLFKQLEIDLQLLGASREMYELQKVIVSKRSQLEKIIRQRHEFQSLQDAATAIDSERRTIDDRLAVLRTLQSLGPVELSVISPAKTEPYPTRSNRKYLFAGMFILGVALLLGGLLGLEIGKNGLLFLDDVLPRIGLNIVGELPMGGGADSASHEESALPRHKAIRQMALQIRQTIAKPNAMILFSQLDSDDYSPAFLGELGECFARRDERVLLWAANNTAARQEKYYAMLDSEIFTEKFQAAAYSDGDASMFPNANPAMHENIPAGLSDYLTYLCVELDEFIFSTKTPGVDCLCAGRSEMLQEGFATHRISELLTQLREKYSMVLVDGPTVDQEADLELLAACCDGIIFLAHDARKLSARTGTVLHSLNRLHAPVMGAVVL